MKTILDFLPRLARVFTRRTTIAAAFVLLGILALGTAPPARAQVTVSGLQMAVSNSLPLVIAAANQTALSAQPAIDIVPGRGISFQARMSCTNASTANTGFLFAPSVDGTNYATSYWVLQWAQTGTTEASPATNFPAAMLDGYRKFKLVNITNGHSASLFVTNAYFGRGNP